jgi:hypothetical protein
MGRCGEGGGSTLIVPAGAIHQSPRHCLAGKARGGRLIVDHSRLGFPSTTEQGILFTGIETKSVIAPTCEPLGRRHSTGLLWMCDSSKFGPH